jgi:hypothetical protein
MSMFPYQYNPSVAGTVTLYPFRIGTPKNPSTSPFIPSWPDTQQCERQALLDELRAIRKAIDRLIDAQLAAFATGRRARIRVKAGSRKLRAAE